MSTNPPKSKKLDTAFSSIFEVSSDLVFIPSPPQRKCKSKFWITMHEDPQADPNNINVTMAVNLTGNRQLEHWWKQPGFEDWFKGKEEFRERVEYLCQIGLDTAEEILLSDDPKAVNAKVSLIKVLMEAGGKISKTKEVKILDEAVQKMNKAQLEAYIKKHGMLAASSETKKEINNWNIETELSPDTDLA
jgi:hypothetical protein